MTQFFGHREHSAASSPWEYSKKACLRVKIQLGFQQQPRVWLFYKKVVVGRECRERKLVFLYQEIEGLIKWLVCVVKQESRELAWSCEINNLSANCEGPCILSSILPLLKLDFVLGLFKLESHFCPCFLLALWVKLHLCKTQFPLDTVTELFQQISVRLK